MGKTKTPPGKRCCVKSERGGRTVMTPPVKNKLTGTFSLTSIPKGRFRPNRYK